VRQRSSVLGDRQARARATGAQKDIFEDDEGDAE
jgi:hypothetical protein